MKIFFVGGGSGGPIAPLLAVAEEAARLAPGAKMFFVGSRSALERKFLAYAKASIIHLYLPAGKWRRYFSLWNFFDLFKTAAGFFWSFYLLLRHKPDIIFGAGSYRQVPLMWAAAALRIAVVAHQQDLMPLLSTRLVVPFSRVITVSFDLFSNALPEFSGLFKKIPGSKITLTGNPVRPAVTGGLAGAARKFFSLNKDYPTVLVMGGGTGAKSINGVVEEARPELERYVQVIHVTGGREKPINLPRRMTGSHATGHYHQRDFLNIEELAAAYAVADLVVCRAGMSTISELSAVGKPAILVPLPQSAQEDNARYLAVQRAAVVVFEEFFAPELLVTLVRKILWSRELQAALVQNIKRLMPHDAARKIARLLIRIANDKS